ncbi:MAG TPA: alternative ribosome rescue aminoacyl-tRNA hydrolase ArfB [Gemmatimonadaceae bacterium]|nr:alternative ribosome rescue aminoacyl-tRNA hydrolase ArfB [Gemmatimonadaceae bacterium]
MIETGDNLTIPDAELDVKATRASGAGGQHVNKTSSRIEITWNIVNSRVLTDEQRQILVDRLASRISGDGSVRVVASEFRSQKQNRERAEARLAELIRKALTPRKKRKPTRRPKSADEARLASKKLRSRKKRERRGDEY